MEGHGTYRIEGILSKFKVKSKENNTQFHQLSPHHIWGGKKGGQNM